ncbi:MAG: glucose-6-phosphate isomerase [Syntrophomonadaceae bacterium]|nr:glucose-6-phosphate isomerase [Syntrophomonadaceae bacterium]
MIRLDFSNSCIAPAEVLALEPEVLAAAEELRAQTLAYSAWIDYPLYLSDTLLKNIEADAVAIRKHSSAFVLIGIGGSYLGSRAALNMLQHTFHNELSAGQRGRDPKIYYAGHHLSSSYYAELLDVLAYEDVSVCVISKSGGTMESAAAFSIFKELLEHKYGAQAADRIYAITDASAGSLRAESDELGYHSYEVPTDIGGRYSVLSPVGLLPMAVAGIPIRRVIEGAREEYEALCTNTIKDNPAYQYAALRRLLNRQGKQIEIFESYEPKLQYFMEWLKQLFGESEGKEGQGLFPASLMFTTDLHSMGQYLQQGTPNFFETILHVMRSERHTSAKLPGQRDYQSIHTLNQIVEAGVVTAHSRDAIPNLTIGVDALSPESFGALVYFFELACAVSCRLLGVNPFDQPGVEQYKQAVRELLNK